VKQRFYPKQDVGSNVVEATKNRYTHNTVEQDRE